VIGFSAGHTIKEKEMSVLAISSNCVTHIELRGAAFGRVVNHPSGNNVKRFSVNGYTLDMEVHDMNTAGIKASVEIQDEGAAGGAIVVSSDSNAVTWKGATKFRLDYPGGTIQETVESGIGGTNSKKTQTFNIPNFK
jgi:hypothetical protein